MRRQLEVGSSTDLAFFVGKLRSENRILYAKRDLEETISLEYQYDSNGLENPFWFNISTEEETFLYQ